MNRKMRMTRIIINADDLGLNLKINSAIEEAIVKGAISSTTMLVNGNAFDDAVRIAKQYPKISVGVHLNLVEFKPLTVQPEFVKNGIVDSDGYFVEGAFVALEYVNSSLKKAIFEEWDAQITKFKEAGLCPTHIDSHQHIHHSYALMDVVKDLMNKHHIKSTRTQMPISIWLILNIRKQPHVVWNKSNAVKKKRKGILPRALSLMKSKCYALMWRREIKKDYALADSFYDYYTMFNNYQMLRPHWNNKTVELMCHPGLEACSNETDLVLNDALRDCIDYQLISYIDLTR